MIRTKCIIIIYLNDHNSNSTYLLSCSKYNKQATEWIKKNYYFA